MEIEPIHEEKILIIRLGAIGDVVHTTNLLHSIKKAYPDVEIHYLTSELIKPLISNDSAISKIYTVNDSFKMFSGFTKKLAKELKAENFDFVINLQPSLKVKYLLFLAKIKECVNYRKSFKMHAVKNFWSTGLKVFPGIKEEKELRLYLPNDEISYAKEIVQNFRRPIFVINAGGILSKRQGRAYPVDKWIEVGNQLQERYNGTVILNGASEDRELLSELNKIKNSYNFIGKLSLVRSCAVISQADLMLSGDSGPLHIATALGVNSIGLFGSMPVSRTGCYSCGVNIASPKACVPCNRRKCKYLKGTDKLYAPCMEEISPDEVVAKASEFLRIIKK